MRHTQSRTAHQKAAVSLKKSLLSATAAVSVKAGSTRANPMSAQIAATRIMSMRRSAISLVLRRVGRLVGILARHQSREASCIVISGSWMSTTLSSLPPFVTIWFWAKASRQRIGPKRQRTGWVGDRSSCDSLLFGCPCGAAGRTRPAADPSQAGCSVHGRDPERVRGELLCLRRAQDLAATRP
jgi:hypothetical protein